MRFPPQRRFRSALRVEQLAVAAPLKQPHQRNLASWNGRFAIRLRFQIVREGLLWG
jgi:hypothetical protein